MRRSGTESWRFAHHIDQGLHFVLYVRDALGLKVEMDARHPPELAGGVPNRSSLLAPEAADAAAARWPSWWRAVVSQLASAQLEPPRVGVDQHERLRELAARHKRVVDPPAWGSLADSPPLREGARALWTESCRWFDLARRPNLPPARHDVFAWKQVRAAAERAAAEHQVDPGAVNGCAEVLLVNGSWWQLVTPGVTLCSIAAARDAGTTASVLKAVFDSYLGE